MAAEGRRIKLTKQLGAEICKRICEKYSLRQIEKMEGMPAKATILEWVWREGELYEWFADQYARALKIRAMAWAEECIDIADDGANDYYEREGEQVCDHEHIQRTRVRIDTRKFLMAKALPKVFGDQVDSTNTAPKKTNLIFNKGDTRQSKQVLPEKKEGTND